MPHSSASLNQQLRLHHARAPEKGEDNTVFLKPKKAQRERREQVRYTTGSDSGFLVNTQPLLTHPMSA